MRLYRVCSTGFIHEEAPMYRNGKCQSTGASAADVMLTHAVSRIMLNGSIDNIQMSWVKEGPKMAQILLSWGANDFGGTLINESISTSAGSQHGQLLRPSQYVPSYGRLGKRPQNETPHMRYYAHLMKIWCMNHLMMQIHPRLDHTLR